MQCENVFARDARIRLPTQATCSCNTALCRMRASQCIFIARFGAFLSVSAPVRLHNAAQMKKSPQRICGSLRPGWHCGVARADRRCACFGRRAQQARRPAAGCSRRQDPSPAIRSKQTACDMRGPARSRTRYFRLSLKVQGKRSRGWAWRSLSASCCPSGAIRCFGCQTSISISLRIGLTIPLCLAGLASRPVQREGGAAHRSGCGHPIVSLRRDAQQSRAATSTGRHTPVRHGACLSPAHVRARDCDGVCFGQLTHTTRLYLIPAHCVPVPNPTRVSSPIGFV